MNPKIKIVNVKKKELNKRDIKDFTEWIAQDCAVYIGRDMSFYVEGAKKSKWANPYKIVINNDGSDNRDECLRDYKKYIKNTPELYNCLYELDGKELGCWCNPEKCHGDILNDLRYHQIYEISLAKTLSKGLNTEKYDKFCSLYNKGLEIKDASDRAYYYASVGLISKMCNRSKLETVCTKAWTKWNNLWKYSEGKCITETESKLFAFRDIERHSYAF